MSRLAMPQASRGEQQTSAPASAWFSRCASPRCATGWMRLWRNRRVPAFEGQWSCSGECMAALVEAAVRREMHAPVAGEHAHRIPLGLMLVEQGRISAETLRTALLERQRVEEETGRRIRLGQWLVAGGLLERRELARALGAQWNAPALSLASCLPEELVSALPAFFSITLEALPVRLAAGRLLYVAFSGKVDRSLCYAVAQMCGMPVTAGIADDAEFHSLQRRFLASPAPRVRIQEAASASALARALTRVIEAERPVDARLIRVHQTWWLRLWRCHPGALPPPRDIEDVLCTIRSDFSP